MTKKEVLKMIESQPEQTLADIELLKKELAAMKVLESQYEKRLVLMENIYKVKIKGLEEEVRAQNAKAIEYWSAVIEIRTIAHRSLFISGPSPKDNGGSGKIVA